MKYDSIAAIAYTAIPSVRDPVACCALVVRDPLAFIAEPMSIRTSPGFSAFYDERNLLSVSMYYAFGVLRCCPNDAERKCSETRRIDYLDFL